MEIIPNWHPFLVHFTIALYIVSSLLFVSGYFVKQLDWKEKITSAAYINFWLGAVVTFLTIAAGIYAYNTVDHDTPSHLAMTDHRNWGLITAAFYWGLAIWSIFLYRSGKSVGLFFIFAVLIGTSLIAVTGYKGGEIVYRYGLGVMSLPEVSGEGHDHSHEGDSGHDHGKTEDPEVKNDCESDGHSHEH